MISMGRLRVMVLMGGKSHEREVSLSTGAQILKGLNSARYDAYSGEVDDLLNQRNGLPDMVFIALHGRGGEDGSIQGLLEWLGTPYTGSGILASALAINKTRCKQLFRAAGLPVLPELALRQDDVAEIDNVLHRVNVDLGGFPVFLKPNSEGSTFGCSRVDSSDQLKSAMCEAWKYDDLLLVEPYFRGMEVTVGVLGNAGQSPVALPPIEIVPRSEYYDYESKYAAGGSEHIIPARLLPEVLKRLGELAVSCHNLLGCDGMSRTDFIVNEKDIAILETNTIPGMTPTSLLPQAAEHAGISFCAMLDGIIDCALQARRIAV